MMGKVLQQNQQIRLFIENRNHYAHVTNNQCTKYKQQNAYRSKLVKKNIVLYVLAEGVPFLYWSGVEGDYNVMVMELLGPTLEDLLKLTERRYSLKTTVMIADQMLTRIYHMHSQYYIHRDIKPENFLTGLGTKCSTVYLIDFGISKRYLDQKGVHIPYKGGKNLVGTARYTSVNTHLGIEQGRRDDIESILYAIMYFLRGSLPWHCLLYTSPSPRDLSTSRMPSSA
eukprot:TRINITY_DN758_c0_g1_i5.p1 TRINITY_DN758_c0_g1~~TRINITY_DN758_c0_g1_i5.p1  ORF type:complete len:227 (+),score=16.24 TRINITY_DN758_c0_g1_i5:123-803(+)